MVLSTFPACKGRERVAGLCRKLGAIAAGPGVPPEIRDRIFEPLFTTKPVSQGTGRIRLVGCRGEPAAAGRR